MNKLLVMALVILSVALFSLAWCVKDVQKEVNQQREEIRQLQCIHFEISFNGQAWYRVSVIEGKGMLQTEPTYFRLVKECSPPPPR